MCVSFSGDQRVSYSYKRDGILRNHVKEGSRFLNFKERMKLWFRHSRLVGSRYCEVYHQDSPGVRVWVLRNRLTSLFASKMFSEVGETHLRYCDLDAGIPLVRMS